MVVIHRFLVMSILVCSFSDVKSQASVCDTKQQQFAEKQTEFMHCVIVKAEPVEYCIKCSLEYWEFLASYDDLMNTIISQDSKNVSCRSLKVDNDRLNLIENINAYTRNLWNMGFCSDCYDCNKETMPFNCTLTNETMDFNAKFNAIHECISTNLIGPCLDCLSDYQTLNNFYDDIRATKGDKFCFDTRDKMNKTRILWSNKLHCCGHRDSSKLTFYALASTAIAIMMAFYSAVFVIEKRIERQQSLIPNDSVVESTGAVAVTEQNDLNKPSTSNEPTRRRVTPYFESSNDTNDSDGC